MTVQALAPDAARSERVPQINIEAEHELLGALIMRPASIAAVQAILSPSTSGSTFTPSSTRPSSPPLRRGRRPRLQW